MDTFKGQDNAEIKEFCSKTDRELVIVTHNLTNKCWPLGITINHKAPPINSTYGMEIMPVIS